MFPSSLGISTRIFISLILKLISLLIPISSSFTCEDGLLLASLRSSSVATKPRLKSSYSSLPGFSLASVNSLVISTSMDSATGIASADFSSQSEFE